MLSNMDRVNSVERALKNLKPRLSGEKAFELFLQGYPTRSIADLYSIAHMTVAFRIRKTYGRYATNDVLLSVYRTLLKDYEAYRDGTDRQRKIWENLWRWALTSAIADVQSFSKEKANVRYAKDATKGVKKFYAKRTEEGLSVFNTKDITDFRYARYSVYPQSTPIQEWWSIDWVIRLTGLSKALISQLIDQCLIPEEDAEKQRQNQNP